MVAEGSSTVSAASFKAAMLAAGKHMAGERDSLSGLDAAAGDGDLGATLAAGFTHVDEALNALPEGEDVGTLVKTAGTTLARKAPSTFGALLGGGFMRVGSEFQGVTELSAEDVSRLMERLLTAISERGGAVPGQRTMVDALDGGARAAAEAAAGGRGAAEVFAAAAGGASEAADATAEMDAQFGRAAWVSERAKGHRDAGAVAWATYIGALANSIRSGEE
jgi:phosphoenolpyruvate---glycerone phosphotransferase subunit DhaL